MQKKQGFQDQDDKRKASESGTGLRRSGQTVCAPKRLVEEKSGLSIGKIEERWREFNNDVDEVIMEGGGIGGGFNHSSELNVMKYNKVMQGDQRYGQRTQKIFTKCCVDPSPERNL
jgi:hypothetical protein